MALPKSNLSIPFGVGINTKMDPFQVPPGQMLELRNAQFNTQNMLQKRNGFVAVTRINDSTVNTLTTFKSGLTAIGDSLYSYAPEIANWVNKGELAPVQTQVQSLVRSSSSQTSADTAITPGGLACTVWEDSDGRLKYQVSDVASKSIVVPSTNLPPTATSGRVFLLNNYFIITYLQTVVSATYLYAQPLLTSTLAALSRVRISSSVDSLTAGYDAVVSNNGLYFAWSDATPAGRIQVGWLDFTLLVRTPNTTALLGYMADFISVSQDTSTPTPTIYVSFKDTTSGVLYTSAFATTTVAPVLGPTSLGANPDLNSLTSIAENGAVTVFYQTENFYPSTSVRTDFVSRISCTQTGGVGTVSVVARSVGLASKPFTINSRTMFMAAQDSPLQSTYFLIDSEGVVLAKLAYSNGGGYATNQILPSPNLLGNQVQIAYRYKATLTPANKAQGVLSPVGIYAQTGVNLVSWDISTEPMRTVEIGENLTLSGGFLWAYDGVAPVEHGFHLYPEGVISTEVGAGNMSAQLYYYQFTYEWTDAQGNLQRSAPSLPSAVVVASANAAVTVQVPTLRLTEKVTNNLVRLVGYRWSAAQQTYYQITSILNPLINDPTLDSIDYIDTLSDADILGNQIIYTTGGVVENIGAPASVDLTLFKNRLVLIDAENRNRLWFSKPVFESTPVEMSDLFTFYVAPTAAAQGSTGDCTALSVMDDKLIIFKREAIYYVVGNGPDITGANNDFSEPVYITASVGCINPKSIVLMAQGLMFQSDKGIWLLSRDLNTTYIGAPVERYNFDEILSAVAIPGTNQVRFTLNNGLTLMYDYFFGQWGVFSNVPAISSTLYENLHTYVNSLGQVFQETPNLYLDGSSPVLMSFTTSWFNLAGLQGLERAYFFYLLGRYITPHKWSIGIAYDYNPSISQQVLINPTNYSAPYGLPEGPYGSESPYGGQTDVEQNRIFLNKQKIQSFQITLNEVFDPSFGTVAGAGFTLSGINLVVSSKKTYATLKASKSVG